MYPLRLVGVDGCRSGWVVALTDLSLGPPEFRIVPTFRALLDGLQGTRALIAVDIPIGLASGLPHDAGTRLADSAARAFLGGRRGSSVFSAPCRPTLAATSYREACNLEALARGHGTGLSQQAYNIIPKIREVDEAVLPSHQEPLDESVRVWVREAHPEVIFAVLKGDGRRGHGLIHAKRGCANCRGTICPGESERLALLGTVLPSFDPGSVREELVREHRQTVGTAGPVVGRDDIVDAAACLVSAYRIASGLALTLPTDDSQVDARGLRMEIVA
jgi:predicted RNase H-like nuclease